MSAKLNNLLLRTVSGIVYVAFLVGLLMFDDARYFWVPCVLFTIIGVWEFQKMMLRDEFYAAPLTVLVDVLIATCISGFAALFAFGSPLLIVGIFIPFIALVLLRMVMALYSHATDPVRRFAVSAGSWIYVGLGLASLNIIGMASMYTALLMLIMIWLNDTGAFIVGSLIGRHKLFPRLSPNKSWEGFVGGMLFSVLSGVALIILFPKYFGSDYVTAILMGVVVSVFATWGDLFESMVKRHAGVKDSGNIIPGHGGVLDRVDSILFVSPAVVIVCIAVSLFSSTTVIGF